MYDLLDKIYTDVIIQPGKAENEHKAFCDMADRYTGSGNTIRIKAQILPLYFTEM